MITTIQFVPGAVTAGQPINLPAWAPKIDSVVSAYLIRPTAQISIANHPAHDHKAFTVMGSETGADQTAFVTLKDGAGTTIGANVVAKSGLSSNMDGRTDTIAAMAHSVSGGNPVVNVTPTKVDEDTITLNQDTQLGDILVLSYIRVGVRRKAS